MDGKLYVHISKENLKRSAESFYILEIFILYHDNDPKHKEENVSEWLLYTCPKVLQTPAQSSDHNPMENQRDEFDRHIRKREISSNNDLKYCLKEEWHKISASNTIKLVESIPSRLQSVLNQKDYPTKY